MWAVGGPLAPPWGNDSRVASTREPHGGAVAATGSLVLRLVALRPSTCATPLEAKGIWDGIGDAEWVPAAAAVQHTVHLSLPQPAAKTTLLLVRELGPAPRSLRRRILVTPPPTRRHWTPMHLAEAACCMLGWVLRSVHLRVDVTLGFFSGYLVVVLTALEPIGATANAFSVCLTALVHQGPVG